MRKITLATCLALSINLTGCIAEDDDDEIVNDQGETITDQTASLSGFWNGQFNQTTDLRVLIYNGNVYGLDADNGYYGDIVLNAGNRTVIADLTAYALNTDSDSTAKQFIADGNEADYELDTQLSSLQATDDSLFGGYSVDGTSTGNILLTRDGTWENNSPLSALIKTGKWTATNYELVTTRAGERVTFTGVSTDSANAGCIFRGELTTIDTNFNLYRATLSEREDCPAFNESEVPGFAGFNSDGDLEFYFRASNSLLFMTFTPPADASGGGDSGGDAGGDAGNGDAGGDAGNGDAGGDAGNGDAGNAPAG